MLRILIRVFLTHSRIKRRAGGHTLLWALIMSVIPASALAIGSFRPAVNELALLPGYCAPKAQPYGDDAKHPEVAPWADQLGYADYRHLHHYCDALLHIMRANRAIGNATQQKSLLSIALLNLDYMQKNASAEFSLQAEIAVTRGQVLERLGRPAEALAEYQRAMAHTVTFAPAYMRLADLYLKQGKRAQAEQTVRAGLEQAPTSAPLLRRLEELGRAKSK